MDYLIIGGGVAGISGAAAIRELDKEGRITVLGDEPHPFYTRIRLPDFLAGRVTAEALLLKQEEWYRQQRIDLRLRQQVVAVDAGARTARTAERTTFPYDRLLLATGGTSFLPPVPGIAKQGVFTLRTLDDAIRIREYGHSARQVAVVGGGVLGLEAGNGLLQAGCEITVVEFFDRLLPRQTDPACSAMLQEKLEAMGFCLVLAASVKEVMGEERVTGLLLADGRQLACDMVIVAAGIRANALLAREMGLAVDKGVLVDDRMVTSQPEVFAAGDLVQHNGVTYGIWPAAQQQGEVAGANMAGGDRCFTGMVPANLLKVAGIDLFAVGDIDADGRHRPLSFREPALHQYRKLVLDEEARPIGAILFGDLTHRRRVVAAIDRGEPVTATQQEALRQGRFEML